MNEGGHAHYKPVDSSDAEDSDDGDVIDLTRESDAEESAQGPRKRVKTEASAAHLQSVPKWSNPDPYTSLPPTDTHGAPKKDIVNVIRKAKIDSGPKSESTNAVKNNIDFISFNLDDDSNDDSDDRSEEGQVSDRDSTRAIDGRPRHAPPRNAPAAPAATSAKRNRRHHLNGATTELEPEPVPSSFRTNNSRTIDSHMSDGMGPPPPPPAELVMPTDQELAALHAGDSGGKKRKRGQQAKGRGDVVPEWEVNESNPTPWCTIDHSHTVNVGLRYIKTTQYCM